MMQMPLQAKNRSLQDKQVLTLATTLIQYYYYV